MGLLYKYYGFSAGLAAISKNSLGFSKPTKFNDPMEGRLWLHQNGLSPTWLEPLLDSVGILCMTRNHLNPLMWSHYGENHTGFVIGYDDGDLLFSDQRDTVIDAQSGSTFTESQYEFSDVEQSGRAAAQWVQLGMDELEVPDIAAAIRHIFLMKQHCWNYEEEVRIVKLLSSAAHTASEWVRLTGNTPTPISTPVAPKVSLSHPSEVFTLEASPQSIKHIILGMRNPLVVEGRKVSPDDDLARCVSGCGASIELSSWDENGEMQASKLETKIDWGWPNDVSSVKIEPEMLKAISGKISGQPLSTQSLTVTNFNDGRVCASWDDEL
ncbi:hypothetical protein TRL7639_01006 [Falsiruegeria litorea R37]|uniref:DUF2971 domain-containing protein n=2 Tax=Falsiruegeria litorea TaxID=1280831 RepID=A0A1Y5RWV3_9RHOB|nr:hypothetical protein TRL7639_01006 [Falsiruegeria litorea R37]